MQRLIYVKAEPGLYSRLGITRRRHVFDQLGAALEELVGPHQLPHPGGPRSLAGRKPAGTQAPKALARRRGCRAVQDPNPRLRAKAAEFASASRSPSWEARCPLSLDSEARALALARLMVGRCGSRPLTNRWGRRNPPALAGREACNGAWQGASRLVARPPRPDSLTSKAH